MQPKSLTEPPHQAHWDSVHYTRVPCTCCVTHISCVVFAVLPSCGHKPPQLVTTPSSALQVSGSAFPVPCTRHSSGEWARTVRKQGTQPTGEEPPAAGQLEAAPPVRDAGQPTQPHAGRQRQAGTAGGPSLADQGQHLLYNLRRHVFADPMSHQRKEKTTTFRVNLMRR